MCKRFLKVSQVFKSNTHWRKIFYVITELPPDPPLGIPGSEVLFWEMRSQRQVTNALMAWHRHQSCLGKAGRRGEWKVKVLVSQSCLTLCHPLDYNTPGSSKHRIFQVRILEWLPFPSLGDLLDPGIEPESPVSPTLKADSLFAGPSGG